MKYSIKERIAAFRNADLLAKRIMCILVDRSIELQSEVCFTLTDGGYYSAVQIEAASGTLGRLASDFSLISLCGGLIFSSRFGSYLSDGSFDRQSQPWTREDSGPRPPQRYTFWLATRTEADSATRLIIPHMELEAIGVSLLT